MLDFVIIVNDGGELKTVTRAQLAVYRKVDALDSDLNTLLDDRAIAAGEYDPSDNDTPFEVTMGADE